MPRDLATVNGAGHSSTIWFTNTQSMHESEVLVWLEVVASYVRTAQNNTLDVFRELTLNDLISVPFV